MPAEFLLESELLLEAYARQNEAFQAGLYRERLKATSVEDLQAEYMRGDIDVDELEAKLEAKFKADEGEEVTPTTYASRAPK